MRDLAKVKPLKPKIGTERPLPVDEIRRSVEPARYDLRALPLRNKPREICHGEAALIQELYVYLSADPKQHNIECVVWVCLYLWFSFGGDNMNDLPMPPNFDWLLIDKLGEEQMVAALALHALWADSRIRAKGHPELIRVAVHTLATAAALRHARATREAALHGSDVSHAEDRELKREAIAAYLQGNYASKDAAAAAIAGNVVPLTFRTVRDHLKGIKNNP